MNMIKTVILFAALVVFVFSSCKKEDTTPPGITITAPVEGQNLPYLDVRANYGDYYLETAELTVVKHATGEQLSRIFNKYGTNSFDSETAGEFNVGYKSSDLGVITATELDVNFIVSDAYGNVTRKTVHCTVTP